MLTDTVSSQQEVWRADVARVRRAVLDLRLLIILVLAFVSGALAYQAPAAVDVPIGWLGDRLFLRASEGQSASDSQSFYGDEITEHARSGRSRWTRAGAVLQFPGIGRGDLDLTLRAQGWPADVLGSVAQPEVSVLADGSEIGRFHPETSWADYTFSVPATLRNADDLTITLASSATFTSTRTFSDPRPKGIRVEYLGLRGAAPRDALMMPALMPLVLLSLNGTLWLLTLLAFTNRPNLSFAITTVLVAILTIGLAFARGWVVALLPWMLPVGILALGHAWRGAIIGLALRIIRAYGRGQALNYGLVVAGALWLLVVSTWASMTLAIPALRIFQTTFPDSLIYGLLGMCVLMMAFVLGRKGLPRIAQSIVDALASRTGARITLGILLVLWLGYLGSVIAVMPYVGHADYADNAVVARNLVAGRGWVVDYVTQFYQLYAGITRPQETWPLLQPVWIAPFFAALGPEDWVAKLPNLLFMLLLALLTYVAGSRLWGRRIGLTAALLLLTSNLFFKLVIYVTSDLAFVLFAFGAIWWLYQAIERKPDSREILSATTFQPTNHNRTSLSIKYRSLVSAAIFTGLMILQKPGSGAIMAFGMGLWLVAQIVPGLFNTQRLTAGQARPPLLRNGARRVLPIVIWGLIALALVTPLVVRNLQTFGRVYYSTESYDAWVLEYTTWDRIYAPYAPELGGDGPPNRSWILRWGFDRTLTKIGTQFEAVRDYLIPSWQASGPFVWLAGRADKDLRLFFDMGAWLTLLGALGALATQRRLMTLLFAAFAPYTLFLAMYWHTNEERYFVALMPWLALLAAAALWRGYDRIAAIGDRRWAPLGLALVVTALALIIVPSYPSIDRKVREEPQLYAADLDVYAWLRANTPSDAVMMTRNPWQLNWHSERPALMIPYTTDRVLLVQIAQYYHARYLVLDSLQRPDPEIRQMLNALVADPSSGVRRVYQTPLYVAEYQGARKEIQAEVYAFP